MLDLNALEQEVLAFWSADQTFQKSVENRRGCSPFVVYEGPPTANGKPGIHHVLTRTFKDLTMGTRFVYTKESRLLTWRVSKCWY